MTEKAKQLINFNDFALNIRNKSLELEKQCDVLREYLENAHTEEEFQTVNRLLGGINKVSTGMKEISEVYMKIVQEELCKGNG